MRVAIGILAVAALLAGGAAATAQPRFTLDASYEVAPGQYKAEYTLDNTDGTVACSDVSGEFEWLYGGVVHAEGPDGWEYHSEYGHPYWETGASENYVQSGETLSGFSMTVTVPDIHFGPVSYSTGPQHDRFYEGVARWLGAAPGVIASDPPDDTYGMGNLDLVQLEALIHGPNLVLNLTINGDIGAADWGKYLVAIDTDGAMGTGGMSEFPDADPPTNDANPWVRNIAITDPNHEAEFFIGSWVDGGGGGGMQLWQFTGVGAPQWMELAGDHTMSMSAGPVSTLTYTIPLATLAVAEGGEIYLEAFSTGGNSFDTANDTVNDPPNDWVWDGADWQAQAGVHCSSPFTVVSAPAFTYLGYEDLGGGMYRHDYRLSNHGGFTPVYNVDTDWEYRYGWVSIDFPPNWVYEPLYLPGPMSRWVTESSPCEVGAEVGGFSIHAATPTAYVGPVYLTDNSDTIVYEGVTWWPGLAQPEFVYESTDDLGDGVFAHHYKLCNLAGEVDLHDVDLDYEYRYGWVSVHNPDTWIFYHGPTSRWVTESAPCTAGSELGGYTIEVGSPDLLVGGVYITDADHVVVAQSTTLLPVAPGPTFEYLGVDEIGPTEFQHNYVLRNFEGDVDIYDVEYEGEYHHAWLMAGGPGDWAVNWEGSKLRFFTDASPCWVGSEMYGFYVVAGTPEVIWGGVTFTDHTREVVAAGSTSWPLPGRRGDMNCDNLINSFDIDPFVLALTGPEDYHLAYPHCERSLADCDYDGRVNAFDIDPFVSLLVGD